MKSIRKEDASGTCYKNEYDLYHRIDGPADECHNGNKYWYINGLVHRIDGPASEYDEGDKFWYIYDQCHRIDGPAVEYHTGTKRFFLFGKLYTETQHSYAIEHYHDLIDSNEYFGERK